MKSKHEVMSVNTDCCGGWIDAWGSVAQVSGMILPDLVGELKLCTLHFCNASPTHLVSGRPSLTTEEHLPAPPPPPPKFVAKSLPSPLSPNW